MSVNYDFWQDMWDKYSEQYLADCRQYNLQAGLSDFQVYCEERDLVPDDEVYING